MTNSTYNFNAALLRQPILIGFGVAWFWTLFKYPWTVRDIIIGVSIFSMIFEYERYHVDKCFTSALNWLDSYKEHLKKKDLL